MVHSFLIFFFSVVAAVDIHVSPRASTVDRSYCKALGRNNSEVGQEPKSGASNFQSLVPWHFHGPVHF